MTNAQQFIGLQEKDVDRSEEVREHREEMRENSAVKLRETAQSIIQRAEEKESQPRLTNTAKRAREAGSVEAQCRSDIRMGHTMIRIADAIEAGTANHLRDIRARTHIEELESVLNTAKYKADTKANKRWDETQHRDPTVEDVEQVEVFPWPTLHRDFARNVVTALQDKPGGIMLARKLSRLLEESNANEHVVSFTTDRLDTLQELASKATEHGLREAEMLNTAVSEHGRWKTMGILDVHTLRAALREYLPLRKPAIRADPIKERMRSLVGVKIDGYFPTPPEVIAKMIDVAELQPGMFVLEPSAGSGHIMDALHEAGVAMDEMECFEINGTLRQILVDKGYAVRGTDFTEYAAEAGRCDRVMMNPPFEDYADISHVVRAFEWLKPGGRLVAITSEGPFFRNDKRSEAFRQWLEAQGGTSEKLETGAFMQSDRPTGVQTRLVVIDKSL
jgi:protein-L-isoaspartate O-methyltransferase